MEASGAIETSIIKEEDDGDELNQFGSSARRNKAGFNNHNNLNENSYVKLNEDSVNVELDTSRQDRTIIDDYVNNQD